MSFTPHNLTCISVCELWEVRVGIQVFRRKLYIYIYIFRSCLVGVKTGKIEKKERKIGWKMFGSGDKTRGKENGVENSLQAHKILSSRRKTKEKI